ncbi:MAG: DNA polymerase III subunit delta' [Deltaproteobacteria bacterium]|nr:DNA polymerase III subunit delta' [Deltaproteobacteria bacterium]
MTVESVASLDDVRGHERAVDQLRRAVSSGRVAHAYLFLGPEGVGKTMAAYAFAAELLAATRDVELTHRKIVDGNHPDMQVLEPEGRFIKKAAVDALVHKLVYAPYEAEWKVNLVLQAETMNPAAANALLKTLEEPGRNIVFLLVTSAPQQLLPTVLSRCQKVVFGPMDADLIERVLVERGREPDDARIIARACDGSLGRALGMEPGPLREERHGLGARFYRLPLGGDGDIARFAETVAQWSSGAEDALEMVKVFLADAIRSAALADARRIMNPDLDADARAFAARYEMRALTSKVRSVTFTQRLLQRNANAPLAVQALLVDILTPRATDFARTIPR